MVEPGSDPPVVVVEQVGAEPGPVVDDDPCVRTMEISWPGTPPVIELDVTLPESVIANELKLPVAYVGVAVKGIMSRLPVRGVVELAVELEMVTQFAPLKTTETPVQELGPADTGGAFVRFAGHTNVLPPTES